MAKKRFRKVRRRNRDVIQNVQKTPAREHTEEARTTRSNAFLEFYDKEYKSLLIIPFIILILALGQITYQTVSTGEFITRGVSLKGGTTITIPTDNEFDMEMLKNSLKNALPGQDMEIRVLNTAGAQTAIVFESDATEKEESDRLLSEIEKITGIDRETYSTDLIGSSLGKSFFYEIIFALVIAFIFMGIVVFLYFRTFVPSIAIILASFSDMVITVAIVNLMGMKLSTAGIAAFLMLIGYSIDTNILLSTRLIKGKEGTDFDKIINSMKTGLTMSFTTLAAVTVVLVLSKSEVLSQIMTILLIGLLIDLMNTWLQNAGILRLYLKRKKSE